MLSTRVEMQSNANNSTPSSIVSHPSTPDAYWRCTNGCSGGPFDQSTGQLRCAKQQKDSLQETATIEQVPPLPPFLYFPNAHFPPVSNVLSWIRCVLDGQRQSSVCVSFQPVQASSTPDGFANAVREMAIPDESLPLNSVAGQQSVRRLSEWRVRNQAENHCRNQ